MVLSVKGLASWDVVLNKGETADTAEAAAKLSKKGSYGRSAGLKKREVGCCRSRYFCFVVLIVSF